MAVDMKILPKGANAPLTNAGSVRVELSWQAGRGSLDVVCFAVGDDGYVPGDDWFLFYNQLQAPDGVIRFAAPTAGQSHCLIQLDRLPTRIQKCVFAAALETGSFRHLTGAALTATPATGDGVGFTLADAGDEQALIFAEIYRHGAGWKFRAIGQGFRGGLQPLAEHFGVAVAQDAVGPHSPPTGTGAPPSSPEPERRSIEPLPPPQPLEAFNRSRRWPRTLAVLVVLLTAGAGVWFLYLAENHDPMIWFKNVESWLSSHSSTPSVLWTPASSTGSIPHSVQNGPPPLYEPPTCTWTNTEVFERYHALGENYIKILQRIDRSNQNLEKWRLELRNSDTDCPVPFVDSNRQEAEQLTKLPVTEWMTEAVKLNNCAGLIIKKVETDLNQESRPIISQRLVREADRARNLESDLTDISRDLAYLRNKRERLLEGFQENLEACLR